MILFTLDNGQWTGHVTGHVSETAHLRQRTLDTGDTRE